MNKPLSLRKKLAEVYSCSERTITNLTKQRWNEGGTTFSKRVAALSLFADKGIDPAPYAKDGELDELRDLQIYLKATPVSVPKAKVKTPKTPKPAAKANQYKLRTKIGDLTHNLSPTEMTKAEAMSEIYYHLYVFENSIRKFILKIMTDNYGKDWWDTVNIRNSTLKRASERMEKEEENRWLDGRRGKHPIFYVDFEDYKAILMNHWVLFEPYFERIDSSQSWVLTIIGETTLSRHNVAHMGYLGPDTRQKILLNLKAWLRQISKV
jgi:hypothetical protein